MKESDPKSHARIPPHTAGVGNETKADMGALTSGGPGKNTGQGSRSDPWKNLGGAGGADALRADLKEGK